MLPTAVADASDQISAGCIADTGANFIATGRGGIPTDPAQGVMESVLLQSFDLTPQGSFSDDFAALTDATTETAVATTLPASQPVSPATDQIVEASSWDYNDRGEVTFVTQTKSAVTSPHHTVSSCLGGAAS